MLSYHQMKTLCKHEVVILQWIGFAIRLQPLKLIYLTDHITFNKFILLITFFEKYDVIYLLEKIQMGL